MLAPTVRAMLEIARPPSMPVAFTALLERSKPAQIRFACSSTALQEIFCPIPPTYTNLARAFDGQPTLRGLSLNFNVILAARPSSF